MLLMFCSMKTLLINCSGYSCTLTQPSGSAYQTQLRFLSLRFAVGVWMFKGTFLMSVHRVSFGVGGGKKNFATLMSVCPRCVCEHFPPTGRSRPNWSNRPSGNKRRARRERREGEKKRNIVFVFIYSSRSRGNINVVVLFWFMQGSPGFGIPGLPGQKGINGERVSC